MPAPTAKVLKKKTVMLSMAVFLAAGVVFFPKPMQGPFVV